MTSPLRFLFDECVGIRVMEQLADAISLSTDVVDFNHIIKFRGPGSLDQDWIPSLANSGIVVITADRGRGPPPKLPLVCKEYSVTHIMMSSSILHMKSIEKLGVLITLWADLKATALAPAGTAFVMRLTNKKRPVLVCLTE